jgi:hypothetical protein
MMNTVWKLRVIRSRGSNFPVNVPGTNAAGCKRVYPTGIGGHESTRTNLPDMWSLLNVDAELVPERATRALAAAGILHEGADNKQTPVFESHSLTLRASN